MEYYLYHHGILGQRWGKRNGPPYPLGESDHSKSEKQAGWKKSLDSGSEKSYNSDKESKEKRHLTDGQKRAIKIGATVAATALLAYGTYRLAKSGKLNELAEFGKSKTDSLLSKIGKNKADLSEIGGQSLSVFPQNVGKSPNNIDIQMVQRINGQGMQSGVDRSINCSHCAISYVLNSLFGMNTTAKGFSGVDEVSGLVAPGRHVNVFKSIFEGIKETQYGNDGENLIRGLNNIPNGSTGILRVIDSYNSGHFVNYEKSRDGIVSIVDGQRGGVAAGNQNLSYLSQLWKVTHVLDLSNASLRDGADKVLNVMVDK